MQGALWPGFGGPTEAQGSEPCKASWPWRRFPRPPAILTDIKPNLNRDSLQPRGAAVSCHSKHSAFQATQALFGFAKGMKGSINSRPAKSPSQ